MAQYDGSLRFNTDIDEQGFNQGTQNIVKDTKRFAKRLGVILAGILTGGVLKTFADFEQTLAEVKALSGATGDEFERLTVKAKEMGATTKFSATESAQAMKFLALAGFETTDIIESLEGVMNLAASSGEDLALVTDIVSDAMTAFGLSAKETTNFADLLAAANSKSNTSVAELGDSFRYAAPIAGALGVSAKDAALALGLMANSSTKASNSGTALRSMLTRLASPTEKISKTLSELNIEVAKNNDGTIDFGTTIVNLRKAFSQLSPQQKASNAEILAGKEAMAGFLGVVNATEKDFNKLSDALNNSSGRAKEMADIMNDTLKGQFGLLKSAISGVAIEIGQVLGPVLKDLVKNALIPAVSAINTFVLALKQLFGASKQTADQQVKSNEAIEKSIQSNVSGQKAVTDEVKKTNKELEGSLAGFDEINVLQEESKDNQAAAEVGGITTGVGGVDFTGAIGDIGQSEIEAELSPLMQTFMDFLEPLTEISLEPLKTSVDGLKESFAGLGSIAFDSFIWFYENVLIPLATWSIEDALPTFIDTLTASIEFLTPVVQAFINSGEWIFDTLISKILEYSGETFIDVLAKFNDNLRSLTETIETNKEEFQELIDIITIVTGVVLGIVGTIAAYKAIVAGAAVVTAKISAVIAAISNPVGLAVVAIAALTAAIIYLYNTNEEFRNNLLAIWDAITEFVSKSLTSIQKYLLDVWENSIKKHIIPALTTLAKHAESIFSTLSNYVISFVNNVIVPVLLPIWNAILEAVAKALPEILETFAYVFEEIATLIFYVWQEALKPLVDFVANTMLPAIKPVMEEVGRIFADIFTSIGGVIGNLFEILRGLIKFIVGAFTDDWSKAWEGVSEIFGGVFKGLVNLARTPINAIIRIINNFLDSLSKIKIEIPSVEIPGLGTFGGYSLGFPSVPRLPEIPALAKGAVIPPNSKFLALLGDQRSGTNIETPLDTMVEAFRTAIQDEGLGNVTIEFAGNLAQLGKVLKPVIDKESARQGRTKVVTGGA